ncbi:MAG: response regulator [Candidatus Symbiothrix sp.]|jgi:signal transduction histidine kinase/ligand-binding sensor domain-containing protein/DNA-binding response OmpR family regulator|nr:response regulator [Candidatus Symbiothrix sp.]
MKNAIFLLLIILPLFVRAQDVNPVQILSTVNGLPTNEVRQVYQDSEGYIWIATRNGLCRYDGYEVKTYKSNLYTPDLLSNNRLTAVAEDSNNRIWIGTDKGLNVLDKTTGKISQIPPDKLSNDQIQVILATKNNTVWIGTSNGLYQYVIENDTFIYFNNASTNYRLRGNDIKTLLEDDKGNIWIGTWNEGITRYDPANGIFYPYPRINPRNSAHCLFQDNQQTIWVGSWGYGLFRLENPYDTENVKYINYSHDKNRQGSLIDNLVYSISQDLNTNYIWIGTRNGLSILKDKANPYSCTNVISEQNNISFNELNSIIRDRSGLMWLGTLGSGIYAVNTAPPTFHLNALNNIKKQIGSASVRSIYVDANRVVWLGIGSYGLVSYHPEKDQYTLYNNNTDTGNLNINGTINSIIKVGNEYWFGTYGMGIFVYNPAVSGKKVRVIKRETDKWLSDDCVFAMKEDSNHKIWIGTRIGICVYDPATATGVSYPTLGQKTNGTNYVVSCIAEGNNNTMWLTVGEKGVIRAKKDATSSKITGFHRYSSENKQIDDYYIRYIYSDSKGNVWAGSDGGGLSCYDATKDVFVSVQERYNIPGDVVSNITEDLQGNLWMATNAGLVMLKDGLMRQYTVSDGLQDNSFNSQALFRTPDGELFFGGHKGYNYFYPNLLDNKHTTPSIVITDIKIFNQSLDKINGKLRKKISTNAPGYAQRICLPYNYNNFSIEFSSLHYRNPMQSQYAYLLNNFDKEWQYTDANKRYATYNNLAHGTYQFYLKSLNTNGVWDEYGALEIEILPPFWLTWWAYLLYCLIIGSIVWLIVKSFRNKLLINNTIHIKNMEQQKIEELNNAKLQFFTNVTHEFLTPLTILSASVDELKMISPENDSYYEIMGSNINRLIRLLQQILEFRKAETGNLKLVVSKEDIAAFVKNCVDNFYPIMKRHKIHLSLVCDPENIPAYFDRDKLDKILFNLLSNASKYNKSGGFVLVNLNYDGATTDRVCISVKDNGDGIKQSELKGLFKRFYEGNYRRFNTIGTGIGLSLTKDLVELHKGEISVESEEGAGTTFFVKIPITREAFDESEVDEYTYTVEKNVLADTDDIDDELPAAPKDYSLLLIEDNAELLKVMVKLLQREYNIFTATNGREGIEILETEDIDLTVSDVMMPIMDGIEFCKYVKNKVEISHVPILLLTAKNKEEDRIEAYDSGADGFISKPFNLSVFHAKIKNLLKAKERKAKAFKKQIVFEVDSLNYTSIDEEFLTKAMNCVREHIDNADFDQQQFADLLRVSKSALYKKLKSLTGLNTSSFIRNIRLKTACKVIEEKKTVRISDLAYAVGFNDPKYFSSCFKKEFGMIPSEYSDKILQDTENFSNSDNAND